MRSLSLVRSVLIERAYPTLLKGARISAATSCKSASARISAIGASCRSSRSRSRPASNTVLMRSTESMSLSPLIHPRSSVVFPWRFHRETRSTEARQRPPTSAARTTGSHATGPAPPPVSEHGKRGFCADHRKLTYHYQGRDFRLTDVGGEIVGPLASRMPSKSWQVPSISARSVRSRPGSPRLPS